MFRSTSKNLKKFKKRLHLNPSPSTKRRSLSHDFLVLLFIRQFCYFLLFPYLPDVNSVLAGLCQYHNQTFPANQSFIKSNCKERCQCYQINGTAVTKCKPLCPIQEDPKCHTNSERIKEFQISLNDTNCTCKKKGCVSGMQILHYLFLSQTRFTYADKLMK